MLCVFIAFRVIYMLLENEYKLYTGLVTSFNHITNILQGKCYLGDLELMVHILHLNVII